MGSVPVMGETPRKLRKIKQEPANVNSYPYNYPLLRQKKDEDYAMWLISEYYRFVEIATYIPLGGIIGLILLALYMFVFLFWNPARPDVVGLTTVHIILA